MSHSQDHGMFGDEPSIHAEHYAAEDARANHEANNCDERYGWLPEPIELNEEQGYDHAN